MKRPHLLLSAQHVHGNFANYDAFHPCEERVEVLRAFLADETRERDRVVLTRALERSASDLRYLDVGCNAGSLTLAMTRLLSAHLETRTTTGLKSVSIVGVDLDEGLVERARETVAKRSEAENEKFEFKAMDALEYLESNQEKFDVTSCFSTTMWIHLNRGDEGLKLLLRGLARATKSVLFLEPQPFKCYKTASKRLRRNGITGAEVWSLGDLNVTNDEQLSKLVEETLDPLFKERIEIGTEAWGRRIVAYCEPILNV